jgi:hypothetical protein
MTQDEVNSIGYALPGRTLPYAKASLSAIQKSIVDKFPTRAEVNKQIEARP